MLFLSSCLQNIVCPVWPDSSHSWSQNWMVLICSLAPTPP
jgi:hypothetical protein